MRVIGLTGGIAMGKSTVASMFKQAGCDIHDADLAVHELYKGEAVNWFKATIPECVINEQVSREALAGILKAKPELLKPLENYIHPLVFQHRLTAMIAAKAENKQVFIVDVPLLFETGGHKNVDLIVTVSCGADEQQKRALARPAMTLEKFNFIISKQWEDKRKQQHSHWNINTLSSIKETENQVQALLTAIKGRFK